MRHLGLVVVAGAAVCFSPAASIARAAEEPRPTFEGLERGSDPGETLRLNAFEVVSHNLSGGPLTFVFGGKWWRATRGKFRHATRYDDFFRAVGRPDLAQQHARRRIVAGTLIWGGLAAQIGGAVLFFTGLYDSGFGTRAKVGLGLFAGGFAASAIGSSVQHPLISEQHAQQMASDYNERLRVHLGVAAMSSDGRRAALARPPMVMTLRARW